MDAEYTFRSYNESDIAFVQSSWGSSYFEGVHYKYLIGSDDFHKYHRPARDRFFGRPDSAILVCCSKEDPDLILGWIAIEKPSNLTTIVHYIYIKEVFRREGLATELLAKAETQPSIFFTHMTETARKIKGNKHKYANFVFAPHLI